MEQQEQKRTHETEDHDNRHETFSPSGTFLFVMLLLASYAIYWAYIWFVVVIEQG